MLEHQEIGQVIGKTKNAVRTKASLLKLHKGSIKFTNEERENICYLYKQDMPLSQIAESMNRPRTSICRIARGMNLTSLTRRKQLTHEQRRAIGDRIKSWIKTNGHPRGCREMRTCPTCGKFFEVTASLKQECCSFSCANRKRFKGVNMFSRSKSGKRKDLNEQFFRSNYEANYARYLNFIMSSDANNNIVKWEFEPDTFEFHKIKKGTRFYTPDFKIFLNDGHIEYHEVKGWDYPRGITARKRFAKYYPHLKLLVIDSEFFKDVKRKGIDRLIPNWE